MKNEEQKELVKFLVLIGVVAIILVGVYFFTRIFVTKEEGKEDVDAPAVGTVNYDVAIVGNMLSKPESKYYVFVYDYESTDIEYYKAMTAVQSYYYSSEKDLLKIYSVVLNDHLNKSFKVKDGEEPNPSAKTIDEFKFGNFTLLKIENGKITKYLDTAEEVEAELKID